jgi:hypothetical protein
VPPHSRRVRTLVLIFRVGGRGGLPRLPPSDRGGAAAEAAGADLGLDLHGGSFAMMQSDVRAAALATGTEAGAHLRVGGRGGLPRLSPSDQDDVGERAAAAIAAGADLGLDLHGLVPWQ